MADEDDFPWVDAVRWTPDAVMPARPHTAFPGLAPVDCDRIAAFLEDFDHDEDPDEE